MIKIKKRTCQLKSRVFSHNLIVVFIEKYSFKGITIWDRNSFNALYDNEDSNRFV